MLREESFSAADFDELELRIASAVSPVVGAKLQSDLLRIIKNYRGGKQMGYLTITHEDTTIRATPEDLIAGWRDHESLTTTVESLTRALQSIERMSREQAMTPSSMSCIHEISTVALRK
jgi:hypothetical protein